MFYTMRLQQKHFSAIKEGYKVLEIRLNDEKRQLIKIGDEIEFSLADDLSQKIYTLVEDLYYFSTFKEAFYSFQPSEYGSENEEDYLNMYEYYSKEDEEHFGVLVIKIKKITEPILRVKHSKGPTKEATMLIDALKERGIRVYVELRDGHKTIDLTIPDARINIEVDGIQHLTDADQILSDLGRGYYSHENGYDTMHIPNSLINSHLEKIVDALAEAARNRQQKIFAHVQ